MAVGASCWGVVPLPNGRLLTDPLADRSGMSDSQLEALDFDRLGGADTTLVERCDHDGFLEESWVSREHAGWRTELLSPGTCRIPGESFDEALRWRVAQWRWVGRDPTSGRDEEWELRAHAPMNALGVIRLLPEPMHGWVRKATRDGIELCGSLVEGGELAFLEDERRLKDELEAVTRVLSARS